jgi:serine/threonine protein kinase
MFLCLAVFAARYISVSRSYSFIRFLFQLALKMATPQVDACAKIQTEYRNKIESIFMGTQQIAVGEKIQEGGYGVVVKMVVDGRTIARKYFKNTEQYSNEVGWNKVLVESQKTDARSKFAIKMISSGYDKLKRQWFLDMEYAPKALYDVAVTKEAYPTGCPELDSPAKVEALFTDVLNGLEFLHSSIGMLHNDVKPENILLKCDGTFVYCDFGCATAIKSPYKQHATLPYAAPEHFDDHKTTVDETADVFSLGITLLFVFDCYNAVPLPAVTFDKLELNAMEVEKDEIAREAMRRRFIRKRYMKFFKSEFDPPTAVGRNLKCATFKWQYASIISAMVYPFQRPNCAQLLQTFQRMMQRD